MIDIWFKNDLQNIYASHSAAVFIDDRLTEGYNPILDDGVGKNIAPLQKKMMIPYEVLNAGQLKIYLNA